jgi:iron complex transport system substrate-binding protein
MAVALPPLLKKGNFFENPSRLRRNVLSFLKKIILQIILFFIFASIFQPLVYPKNSKKNPMVISLSPYITEILFNLNFEKNILAVTSYCNRPKKAKLKPTIGGIIDPNIETILSLNPDLVFATKEDQSLEQVKKMQNMGLNVFVIKEVKNFEDITQNFLLIADAIDKTEPAKIILNKILSELSQIKTKNLSQKSTKTKIFFILETSPLITVSRQSYINDMLEFVNAENIVTETQPRYPFFSKEKLLSLNPDLIICISKPNDDDLKFFKNLDIKTKCIFVNPDIFSRANPYAFLEAVKILDNYSGEQA